jgi:hypothetical protein
MKSVTPHGITGLERVKTAGGNINPANPILYYLSINGSQVAY